MKSVLDYGKGGLPVEVPDANVLSLMELREQPALENPMEIVRRSLSSPIGSRPFQELCAGRKHACIVVSDRTRPVPNRIILPPLLEILDRMKIQTTILVACGMHSPTVGKDLDDLLGIEIVRNYPIVNHSGEKESELVHLGKSRDGADIVINRHYIEADLRICTGFIEPHFMAGFSGGRKSICPGISGAQIMKYAHSPGVLESPCSAAGILDKNPLHEFALEVARRAGVDFIVNVTLNRKKEITGIFAGDLEKAHLEGVAFCKEHACVQAKAEADIVLTSNSGYPLDQDFYQTVKGMVSALPVVKKGGTIIIASECGAGIGSDNFKNMLFEMRDPESFIATISQPGFFCIDQWEVEEFVKVLRKVKVKLYSSGLAANDIARCHVEPVEDIAQAIDDCLLQYGSDATITVIPSGPYVIPYVAPVKHD